MKPGISILIVLVTMQAVADAVDAARPDRWKMENPLGMPRYPDAMPLAQSNPEWQLAWRGLYGYQYHDATLPHLQELLAAKRKTLLAAGDTWPQMVLDKAGIEIALINTVRPGPGLDHARFRWGTDLP